MADIIKMESNRMTLAILAFCAVIYFSGLNSFLPLQEDSALYIILAGSIAKGLGYIYTAGPIDVPAGHFSCIYPAMLSPFVKFFPGNFIALKIVSVLSALALVFLLLKGGAVFFKKRPLAVALLVAVSPQIALYSRHILTEIPYTLLSVAALYFLTKYSESTEAFDISLFVSVGLAAAASYTRPIGMILIFPAVILLAMKRDMKKCALYFFTFACLVLPYFARSFFMGDSTYAGEFLGSTNTVFALLHRYGYNVAATIGKELPDLFFYPFFASIDPRSIIFIPKFALGAAMALLLVSGIIIKLREEGIGVWDIYVIIYVLLYFSWTTHGARYLVPLLPFLYYYILISLEAVLKNRRMVVLAVSVLVFISISGCVKEIVRERHYPLTPPERTFISAADWIKGNLSRESIILSRRPSWLCVYTGGNRGVRLLRTADTKSQYGYILDNNVGYIIIDRNKIYRDDASDYLLPLVRDYRDNFKEIYASREPVTYIYKVER